MFILVHSNPPLVDYNIQNPEETRTPYAPLNSCNPDLNLFSPGIIVGYNVWIHEETNNGQKVAALHGQGNKSNG